jgi:hypothetical protein
MQKPLTAADWNRLEDALAGTSFWTSIAMKNLRSCWTARTGPSAGARAAGRVASKRRSPYGPIRDLGELFIELAGSEAINEYFEYPVTFPMR